MAADHQPAVQRRPASEQVLWKFWIPFGQPIGHLVRESNSRASIYSRKRPRFTDSLYEFFGSASAFRNTTKTAQSMQSTEGTDVMFAKSEIKATWTGEGSLLDVAENAGLTPPFSCRAGVCHTCRCRIVEGEVSYDEQPPNPPDAGDALICIAKPNGRVVLDI